MAEPDSTHGDAARAVTEADWTTARRRTKSTATLSGIVALPLTLAFSVTAMVLADSAAKGALRLFIALGLMIGLLVPLIVVLVLVTGGSPTEVTNSSSR